MTYRIVVGDALEKLGELEAASVQTCVTSPPYWGLRDYGEEGQLGLEPTPDEYVEKLVAIMRGVWRVLRDDGTLWLNLGDSYAGSWGAQSRPPGEASTLSRNGGNGPNPKMLSAGQIAAHPKGRSNTGSIPPGSGLKPKDLVGIPWRVAFALQADGWYLRSDVIWAKPNPMPESVTDRPTKAHEYLFLLTKSPRYFYDADAIREEHLYAHDPRNDGERHFYSENAKEKTREPVRQRSRTDNVSFHPAGRNKRSVWTVSTQPFPGAHFATFPPKLIEPCVKAGTPPKACGVCGAPYERVVEREPAEVRSPASDYGNGAGRNDGGRSALVGASTKTLGWQATCEHDDDSGVAKVLDPFNGAGTTGIVATRLDRNYIGIELNPTYAQMARERIHDDAPLLNVEA